jgi:hypothetical protein
MGQESSLSVSHSDAFNRACDLLGELRQRVENALSLEGLVFSEEYAKGRFSIVCYFEPSFGGERRHEAVAGKGYGHVFEDVIVVVLKANAGQPGCGDDDDKDSVLIKNVQLVQSPEIVIPSAVRAYVVQNQGGGVGAGALYWSLFDGIDKILPRFVEREVDGRVAFARTPDNLAGEQIEGGSEVMNGIADDERDFLGRRLRDLEAKKILSRLRVHIDPYMIGARFEIGDEMPVNLVDVVIGPFDLGFRPREQFIGIDHDEAPHDSGKEAR